MSKAGIAIVVCLVLQIVQSELLTLAVFSLAGLAGVLWLICTAGERGLL